MENEKGPRRHFAGPEPFNLKSARTGNEILMVADRIDRDADGDVRAWHWVNTDCFDQNLITVVVYND